jgi:hypothetical protein
MDYKEGYHSSVVKKKKSGREEFKKDVEEAVAKGTKKGQGNKKTRKQIYKGKGKKATRVYRRGLLQNYANC